MSTSHVWKDAFMRRALLLVVLAGGSGLAFAGSGKGSEPAPSWTVDVGAMDIMAPVFPGGKRYRNAALPSVSVTYKDLVFASFQDGIGVNILRWNGLTAGPVITFQPSRSYSDDRLALRGLTDVPFTIAASGFVNYDFGFFASAKGEVSKSLNGNDGLLADASFTLKAPPLLGNALFLSGGPDFQWYDGNYSRAYFGVSSLNAQQSNYPEFAPGSGFSYGASADAEYLVTEKVSLNVFCVASQYGGGVAKSPILRGKYGTRSQYMLGAAVIYRFLF